MVEGEVGIFFVLPVRRISLRLHMLGCRVVFELAGCRTRFQAQKTVQFQRRHSGKLLATATRCASSAWVVPFMPSV